MISYSVHYNMYGQRKVTFQLSLDKHTADCNLSHFICASRLLDVVLGRKCMKGLMKKNDAILDIKIKWVQGINK